MDCVSSLSAHQKTRMIHVGSCYLVILASSVDDVENVSWLTLHTIYLSSMELTLLPFGIPTVQQIEKPQGWSGWSGFGRTTFLAIKKSIFKQCSAEAEVFSLKLDRLCKGVAKIY